MDQTRPPKMTEFKEEWDSISPADEEKLTEIDESREQLRQITQQTRFEVIKSILMHPDEMPSLEEINFMNPDRSKATLREHLDKLIETGVVDRVELPEEEVTRDNPKVFFALSNEGRELLETFDVLELKETFQNMYEETEKPEWVQQYEDAPRPTSDQEHDKDGPRAPA